MPPDDDTPAADVSVSTHDGEGYSWTMAHGRPHPGLAGVVRGGYCGCADLGALRTTTKFIRVTTGGLRESHPHDVTITREAPNYRM